MYPYTTTDQKPQTKKHVNLIKDANNQLNFEFDELIVHIVNSTHCLDKVQIKSNINTKRKQHIKNHLYPDQIS